MNTPSCLPVPAAPARRPRIYRCGFTLIELLAVIAIIGLLAAIIIPVTGRVRDTARAAQCRSNLRQIGGLFHLFAQDNRDDLPYRITAATEGAHSWDYQLLPYTRPVSGTANEIKARLENKIPPGIFACPSSRRLSRAIVHLSSYSANGTLLRQGGQAKPRARLNLIAEPSRTYLVADGNQRAFVHHQKTEYFAEEENAGDGVTVTARHPKGHVNMLYADGSVRSLDPEAIEWSATAAGVADRSPWGIP
ncbi:prepilin-type N-terminal cleavage/methylation domain-containing protein [Opitutaceae bacterium TAV1]|nr:prepilin-type N-terminal cleavage/methylation domain-containing protein [Opitutaceae bacterium TAV1]